MNSGGNRTDEPDLHGGLYRLRGLHDAVAAASWLMRGCGRTRRVSRATSGSRTQQRRVTSPQGVVPASPLAVLLVVALAGCGHAGDGILAYTPRARDVTITTVPLLSKELRQVYPFLERDFAPGGVLAGREVYAFVPSSVTVVEGDTVRFRFVNPEDDAHTFVLGDLAVGLAGQSETRATWVARRAGIYAFSCSVPSHLPSMWGQLVVLSPNAVGSGAGGTGAGAAGGEARAPTP
jgi:plastocyanin